MKPLFLLVVTVVGFNYLYEFNPGLALMLGIFAAVMLYFFETD
jgi:hypothetical protein